LKPGRVVIPVALEPLDLARSRLHGVEDRQVFRYPPPDTTRKLSFAEYGGVNHQCFAMVWDPATGEQLLKLPNTDDARPVAYAPDSVHLATISGDGGVRVCNGADRLRACSRSCFPAANTPSSLMNA